MIRSGRGRMRKFQGGQLSLLKRLPSIRGFTNIFRQEYGIVNIDQLAMFPAGSEITPDTMERVGFVENLNAPVKILGRGDIDVPLSVSAHKFSQAARAKIEAAGGTVTTVE